MTTNNHADKVADACELIRKLTAGDVEWFTALDVSPEASLDLFIAALEEQKTGYHAMVVERDKEILELRARIAELERQLAEASAPAVEQQPVGQIVDRNGGHNTPSLPPTPMPIWFNSMPAIGVKLYAAPQAADTDKVREESQIRKARDLTLDYAAMHFDAKNGRMVNSAYVVEYLRELKEAPLDASVIVGTSMSAQAPVREVPANWIPISERLPELYQTVVLLNENRWMNTGNDDFDTNWHGAGWLAEFGQKYWSVIGETRSMTLESVTHWMPLPSPPEADK